MEKKKVLGIRINYSYDQKTGLFLANYSLGLGKGSADSFLSNLQIRKAIKGIIGSVYPGTNKRNMVYLFQKLFSNQVELGKMQFAMKPGKTVVAGTPIIGLSRINLSRNGTFTESKQHIFGHTPFGALLNADTFFSQRGITSLLERKTIKEIKKRFPSINGFSRLLDQRSSNVLASVLERPYPYKQGLKKLRAEIRRDRRKAKTKQRIRKPKKPL